MKLTIIETSGEELCKIAEKWGKWKNLANFDLLVAGRLEINRETNSNE